MGRSEMSWWRHERRRKESMEPTPWWMWPFSLLWRREHAQEQDTVPDTVPVPVPDHATTVPMEYKE